MSSQSQYSAARRQVCIISHDVVGRVMAGPGIRYVEMARILSDHHQVTLAIPNELAETHNWPFRIVSYDSWDSLAPHVLRQNVLIFAGDMAHRFPQLAESDAALVIDGYDPLLAEWLALSANYSSEERLAWWPERMKQLAQQYLIGDFFLCASERQRDWWLGILEVAGRINPLTYHSDPSLRSLIDVVPFGLPETEPRRIKPVIKGVWPGISTTDTVILWGGGLWPWLDPLTAIRAVAEIAKEHPEIKLIFPGTRHPNPILHEMPSHRDACIQLATDLALVNSSVFFGDWLPYEDWSSALLECDIALTLHVDTLEARLAFRSRILDYIWAGLPIVATGGDETSNLVRQYQIGEVVDFQDYRGVAAAILHLLKQREHVSLVENFQSAREKLIWRRAVEPLVQFCNDPRRASDRLSDLVLSDTPFLYAPCSRQAEENRRLRETIDALNQQVADQARKESALHSLIQAYENGRFMRMMRWLKRR